MYQIFHCYLLRTFVCDLCLIWWWWVTYMELSYCIARKETTHPHTPKGSTFTVADIMYFVIQCKLWLLDIDTPLRYQRFKGVLGSCDQYKYVILNNITTI